MSRPMGRHPVRFAWFAALALALALPQAARAADIRVHREVLKNGLVLQVVERHALPIVTVQLGVRAGTALDPPGAAGTAHLVAELLTEGTATRSANDIAGAIEFVGGRLGTEAEADFARATVTILKRDLDTGLTLLADVVRHPAFAPAEVARVKKEVLGGIEADEDEPAKVAGKAFDAALFGKHPYAHPSEGDKDTVPGIDAKALETFHDRYYVPEDAVLSFVGDVTVAEGRKLAKKYFGDWARTRVTFPAATPAPAPRGLDLTRIDRPVTQANVVMGNLGLKRTDPDFYPAVVMNYILGGGGFASRMVSAVREKQGLAYSIGSGFVARADPGSFEVQFQTRNAAANQAIRAVLKELNRIRDTPVTEQELADAKANLIGGFPLRIDTNAETADLLTFIAMYGLGTSYFTDYVDRVRAVTVADVQRVAKKYLHPEDMVWVVVANQAEADVTVP